MNWPEQDEPEITETSEHKFSTTHIQHIIQLLGISLRKMGNLIFYGFLSFLLSFTTEDDDRNQPLKTAV